MATVIRELLVRFGVKADNRAVKTFEANINRAKGAMKAAAAGAVAFVGALGAREIAETAENVTNLAAAFKQLGGTEEDMERLRESTKGLVSDDVLMRMSNMASLFGIAGDQVDQLAEIAVGASVATGESVEKMFEDILTASSRQSAMIADNLGILVKAGDANAAAAKRLGKAVKDLTGEEKQRAFVEALIAGGARQRALANKLEATEVAKLKTETRNLFVQFSLLMRKALLPVMRLTTGRFIPAIQKLLDAFRAWLDDTAAVTKALKTLSTVGELLAVIIASIVTAKVLGGFVSLTQTVLGAAIAFKRLGLMATIAQAKIFIIPLAIFALIVALQDMFVWLKGGESLTGRFIDQWAKAPGTLGDVARALQNIKPVLDNLLNDPRAGLGAIGGVIKDSLKTAVDFIQRVLIPLFPMVLDAVNALVVPLVKAFVDAGQVMFGAFADVLPGISDTLGEIFSDVSSILGDVLALVFGQAKLYGTLIKSGLPVAVRLIAAVIKVVKSLMPVIRVVIGTPFLLAKKAFDLILPLVLGAINFILPMIEKVGDFITKVIDDAMPSITSFVEGAVEVISSVVTFIVKAFTLLRDNFWTPLWEGFGKAVDVIKGVITGIIDTVDTAVKGVQKFVGLAETGIEKAKLLFGGDEAAPTVGITGQRQGLAAEIIAKEKAAAARQAASGSTSTTSIGAINVTVEGSTNMGPAGMSKAVEQGAEAAMLKRAGREASNG